MHGPSESRMLAGRFEVLTMLGEGGMGAVYEAFDHETGAKVALKTFKNFSAEGLLKLKREFRTLLNLHHPNFVRLGELHAEGTLCFFTMELVRGRDLLSYVRKGRMVSTSTGNAAGDRTLDLATATERAEREAGVLDEKRLRSALTQLADALCHLHAAGRVHLDIKPSNVLVEDTGRVVLLDFGVASELRTPGVGVAGTLAYMAPEQNVGGALTPATDFYAFGVLLFEALTNRLPFAGERAQVARAKLLGPPPGSDVIDAPEDLLRLSLALLQPHPDARPTGPEVLAVLGRRHVRREAPRRASFVGRERECAELQGWLESARGHGLCVSIEGEAGIGKTALLEEVLRRHKEAYPDTIVLRGRCYEPESIPYKAFDSVIDALSERMIMLSRAEQKELCPSNVAALLAVFPVLRRISVFEAEAGETTNRAPSPDLAQRGSDALVELFEKVAQRSRLVLAIDDLQWADTGSMALFAQLFARTNGITLLCAFREGQGSPPLVHWRRVRRLKLGPLSEAAAQALVSRVLGRAHPSVVRDLCREANGHPLHLLELCRYAAKHPSRSGAQLGEFLGARIRELSSSEREVLAFVTVSASPLSLVALARALRVDGVECQHRVHALCVRHLLRLTSRHGMRCVEPYHDRVREVCVKELFQDPFRVADLHFRLGRALLDEGTPATRERELPRVARHLWAGVAGRSADERALTLSVLMETARVLRCAGAWEAALSFCDRALELLGPQPFAENFAAAFTLYRERMEMRALTGMRSAADDDYAALLGAARDPLERARVHAAMVPLNLHTDDFERALEVAAGGLRELSCALPDRPHMRDLARIAVRLVRHRAGMTPERVTSLPASNDPRIQCALDLLATIPPAAFRVGQNEYGAFALLRIAELSLAHGVTEVSPLGFAGVGMALAGMLFLHRSAARCGEAALTLCERHPHPVTNAMVAMVHGGFLLPWVAPLSEGRAQLDRALALLAQVGDRLHQGPVVAHITINVLMSGRSFADGIALEELVERVAQHGDRGATTTNRCPVRALAFLRAREQDPRAYIAATNRAFEADIPPSRPLTCLYYHGVVKGMALYLADAWEDAWEAFNEADRAVAAGIALPLWAEHLFYKALTACALTERGGSRRAAFASLARVLPLAVMWERDCAATFACRGLLLSAELCALRGQLSRAAELAGQAAEEAFRHGNHALFALSLKRGGAFLRRAGARDAARARLHEAAAAFSWVDGPALAQRLIAEAECL